MEFRYTPNVLSKPMSSPLPFPRVGILFNLCGLRPVLTTLTKCRLPYKLYPPRSYLIARFKLAWWEQCEQCGTGVVGGTCSCRTHYLQHTPVNSHLATNPQPSTSSSLPPASLNCQSQISCIGAFHIFSLFSNQSWILTFWFNSLLGIVVRRVCRRQERGSHIRRTDIGKCLVQSSSVDTLLADLLICQNDPIIPNMEQLNVPLEHTLNRR